MEMSGFKEYFTNLYTATNEGQSNSNQDTESNATSALCGHGVVPENVSTGISKTCGFGNGADSASLIVSALFLFCHLFCMSQGSFLLWVAGDFSYMLPIKRPREIQSLRGVYYESVIIYTGLNSSNFWLGISSWLSDG